MSTTRISDYPKSLPVRLGKSAAFFLFIAILGFLLVKVVGPILQTGPEYVVESLISGVPLLLAAGCGAAALAAAIVRKLRHSIV
ncbi:hypothetical protein [Brevibacterium renqingii]|uniref:hypothetical protein n=1 Tax=Brevibacterium renqingii TaxID=2776916 RepID=UPI001ADF5ED6|nr:hypothetical protein [Brevibacterium renqingii]